MESLTGKIKSSSLLPPTNNNKIMAYIKKIFKNKLSEKIILIITKIISNMTYIYMKKSFCKEKSLLNVFSEIKKLKLELIKIRQLYFYLIDIYFLVLTAFNLIRDYVSTLPIKMLN